jgi:hypothetical protein
MYFIFGLFFMFTTISSVIAKDLKNATGDPEFGRFGVFGFLFSLLTGIAIVAGSIASFLILGWKAIGAIVFGVGIAVFAIHLFSENMFVVRKICDTAIIALCVYVYALYLGYIDPGPWESYFVK